MADTAAAGAECSAELVVSAKEFILQLERESEGDTLSPENELRKETFLRLFSQLRVWMRERVEEEFPRRKVKWYAKKTLARTHALGAALFPDDYEADDLRNFYLKASSSEGKKRRRDEDQDNDEEEADDVSKEEDRKEESSGANAIPLISSSSSRPHRHASFSSTSLNLPPAHVNCSTSTELIFNALVDWLAGVGVGFPLKFDGATMLTRLAEALDILNPHEKVLL